MWASWSMGVFKLKHLFCGYSRLFCGYTRLFHRYTGLFRRYTGPFGRYTGFLCGYTGLFCGCRGLELIHLHVNVCRLMHLRVVSQVDLSAHCLSRCADWSKDPLRGGVSYVPYSLIKNREEKDPPWRTTPKFINFRGGSSVGSLFLPVLGQGI